MSGSSFDNVRYAHVCTILELLSRASVQDVYHIRRLFGEAAEGFEEVLRFVTRLRLVVHDNETLRLGTPLELRDDRVRRREILNRVVGQRNRYRSEMYRFLNRFQVVDGECVYVPIEQHRSGDSAVRNFLTELGVIRSEVEGGKHFLLSEYIDLLGDARAGVNVVSISQLSVNQSAKGAIGLQAEEIILDFERKRVGQELAHKIQHIALENAAAGFDIRSISQTASSLVPRFVEVKAVSRTDGRFFWSKREIHVAQLMSSFYFLYLLPVLGPERFDLDSLEIVQDPCKRILGDNSTWHTEPDSLVCQRNRPAMIQKGLA